MPRLQDQLAQLGWNLNFDSNGFPISVTTDKGQDVGLIVSKMAGASMPAWSASIIGRVVFDTTANKLKVAGAAAWETVTSS